MFDYDEQQVSGEAPAKSQSQSCGCEGHEYSTATSPELVLSGSSTSARTETVLPEQAAGGSTPVCAAHVDAAEHGQLWDDLVASQRPAVQTEGLWEDLVRSQQPAVDKKRLWQALVRSQGVGRTTEPLRLGEVVTRPAMQWTLVDLTAGSGELAGDEDELDTTDAYDRGEYETSEYATSTTKRESEFVPELAFNDGPSPAPAPFVPAESEAPKAKEVKAKKAAAKKTTKKSAAKKTTKATSKKAAAKKATAKKGAKKAAAKKTVKKSTAKRAKKSAATEPASIPLPTSDPTFPRIQAA